MMTGTMQSWWDNLNPFEPPYEDLEDNCGENQETEEDEDEMD